MKLQLNRPLCVFDLETTGTSVGKDRIVEISILKVFPDGHRETYTYRVNPEMPIPAESTAVHGIGDEDVANSPTFKEIAPTLLSILHGSDLAGYNSNRFDVPLLAEELLRAGQDFDADKIQLIDVQTIFHKMEPRALHAAYRYYCDKELDNAHSAEADTLATWEILQAQLERYEDLATDVPALSEFTVQRKTADLAGYILYDESGAEVFGFGKYKNQRVKDVFAKDLGYYGWLQNADFPLYTKKVLTAIQLRSKFSN